MAGKTREAPRGESGFLPSYLADLLRIFRFHEIGCNQLQFPQNGR